MLTDLGPPAVLPAVLVTISDLARREGVSKQAISKRVARFAAENKLTVHDGPRGSRLVSLAEFDRVVGQTADLGRTAAAATVRRAAEPSASHAFTSEQARHKAYQADLAQLDLEERLGRLVPTAKLAEAGSRIAEAANRVIDAFAGRADDVAAAVHKDGTPGARAELRTMSRDLRAALARELVGLADLAARGTAPAPPADDFA